MRKVDTTAIEHALRAAEQKTAAEILPVIVRRSTYPGHIRIVLFLFLLMVFLFAEIYLGLIHWWLWLAPIAAGILAFLLSELYIFEKLFSSKADREQQMHNHAQLMFFQQGLHRTEKGTGILLFISLKEHFAVVLADETIAKKVPTNVWNEVIKQLVDVARKEDITAGLCKAIKLCGEIAASHFPASPDDKNEIHNQLIFID